MALELEKIQRELCKQKIDGWLLYDFQRNNELACAFLEIPKEFILSRRFFYWIPSKGEPIKVLHAIEKHNLDHLPGCLIVYQTWGDLENTLGSFLSHPRSVAMEYSPRNIIPAVSKVDAGTIDLVRDFGVQVVSSADLLQKFTGVWGELKWKSHLYAAQVLENSVERAWQSIAEALKKNQIITEFDIQQNILNQFAKNCCVASDAPICAVNAHSADPHFTPSSSNSTAIKKGDFILIDLWCKRNIPHGVYADITRVGVAASEPTTKQRKIFEIVKSAQVAATDLVRKRFAENMPLKGCEVDQCCRKVIEEAGYGSFFVHRTGHNIDEQDHGNGTHMDSYETYDTRQIIPGTCFSIEPGIYLPGEFGVRLEYDVFVHHDGRVQVTGGEQKEIKCIF